MDKKIKKIECSSDCGFVVRDQDEEEIAHFAMDHALRTHNVTISREAILQMIEEEFEV